MKKATVALVAVMVVLAGCSGGGGTATPTDTANDAEDGEMDGTMTPESDDGTPDSDDGTPDSDDDTTDNDTQVNFSESLENLNISDSGSGDLFSNATTIDVTLYNGTETITMTTRNDTSANRSILTLANSPQSEETTYYETADFAAFRNTTSGEIRYGEPDSGIGASVAFASLFVVLGSVSYTSFVEWDSAEQTTVNGQTAVVFKGNSLNRSAFDPNDNREEAFGPDQVDSVDGRMVIGQDGTFHSLDVEIIVDGKTFGTDLSLGYEPVSVSQPDWVDESEAPN